MRQTEREEKQMGRSVAGSGEAHSNVTPPRKRCRSKNMEGDTTDILEVSFALKISTFLLHDTIFHNKSTDVN